MEKKSFSDEDIMTYYYYQNLKKKKKELPTVKVKPLKPVEKTASSADYILDGFRDEMEKLAISYGRLAKAVTSRQAKTGPLISRMLYKIPGVKQLSSQGKKLEYYAEHALKDSNMPKRKLQREIANKANFVYPKGKKTSQLDEVMKSFQYHMLKH